MEKIFNGIYKITLGTPEPYSPMSIIKPLPREEELNNREDYCCPFTDQDFKVLQKTGHYSVEIPLSMNEELYGFGLQLKSFRQSGKKKIIRTNSDPTADTGDSHAPVPFYVSTKGYGVLVNTARYVTFYCGNCKKVGDKQDKEGYISAGTPIGHWEIKSGSGNMIIDIPCTSGVELYVFCGKDLKDVVSKYNLFSGGGVVPPIWGLGILYRADMNANQEQILSLAQQIRDDDIPCDILGLEPGWQTHAYSCTYNWDRNRFPDHEDMLQQLMNMGYKANLWEHAYVHPDSNIFDQLKPFSGDYYVWDGLIPDFTDEKAIEIFLSAQEMLVKEGIQGFKLDECDNSDFTSNWGFPDITHFPSGLDGEQMHSVFGLLYQKAMLTPFNKRNQRTYGQVRQSHAFASPYPYVLYSDLYSHVDFVRGMASASFSGLLWSPEVRQTETEEELLRRLEAVILSPMVVINCFMIPSPPWKQFDYEKNKKGEILSNCAELTEKCRSILNLRMRLIPYLYAAFYNYYKTGIPPIRALILDYPEDKNTMDIFDEFIIGENILAAPVIAGCGTHKSIYLPKGVWYDFYTRERLDGGHIFNMEVPLDKIPLFIKEGTLLPLAKPLPFVKENSIFELELLMYGQGEGLCTLYADDGVSNEYRNGKYVEVLIRSDGVKYTMTGDYENHYKITTCQRIGNEL